MINLSKACIICQATESLNTNTTIKISENEQYSVSVCSACEDNASPKMMRASLIAILERVNGACLELTKYLGYEVTLISICNPSAPQMAIEVEQSQELQSEPKQQQTSNNTLNKPQATSRTPNGPQMLNKPISRDQKRGGAPNQAPQFRNTKVLNKVKDPTGKPIDLPKDIVVLQTEKKIESGGHSNLAEASYKDGYRQCNACNGEGGAFLDGETKVCTRCGGSGIL